MKVRPDTAVRRMVDVAVAVMLLFVATPLLLAVAVAIRLDSVGPVFYAAQRVGRGDRLFRMLKFRSMRMDADAVGPAVSGLDDPRVTRVGRLLRRSKIDELPQLLNVVRGTMTIVGPRAESPLYRPHYTAQECLLLDVRPGITGPGQLEFTRRQAAELDGVVDPDRYYVEHQLHEKLALDLAYLRDRSLRRDLAIVVATVGIVLTTVWSALRTPRRQGGRRTAFGSEPAAGLPSGTPEHHDVRTTRL